LQCNLRLCTIGGEVSRSNLENNPNLWLLSYSGTMAGALVLYFRTSNMDDIDGTKARQGRGNMQWTLSDKTTQYRYHQWYCNSWQSGQYILGLASTCGASQIKTTVASKVAAVTSKSECEKAPTQLFNSSSVVMLSDPKVPQGCITQGSTVSWNPSGTTTPESRDDVPCSVQGQRLVQARCHLSAKLHTRLPMHDREICPLH